MKADHPRVNTSIEVYDKIEKADCVAEEEEDSLLEKNEICPKPES
ncbi:MAG: hypothetical protein R2764_13645 [Bacteroidales bacterium]